MFSAVIDMIFQPGIVIRKYGFQFKNREDIKNQRFICRDTQRDETFVPLNVILLIIIRDTSTTICSDIKKYGIQTQNRQTINNQRNIGRDPQSIETVVPLIVIIDIVLRETPESTRPGITRLIILRPVQAP